MITGKKVFALAALMVATGAMMEMTQSSTRAAEPVTMTRIQAYAAARLDTAFDLVAAMPASAPVMVPMAHKGDLIVPPVCADMQGSAQDECMDAAYELESAPSIVVETRQGSTSTLMRMDPFTLADIKNELQLQSE